MKTVNQTTGMKVDMNESWEQKLIKTFEKEKNKEIKAVPAEGQLLFTINLNLTYEKTICLSLFQTLCHRLIFSCFFRLFLSN